MTVGEQLRQLSELGKQDLRLKELKDKQKTLPQKANDAKNRAQDLDLRISALQSNIKDLELKKNQKDLEVQSEKSNLRKWESRADKIKGEREYTTLMSEIGNQKKLISDLETQLLEIMQEQDQIKKNLESVQIQLQSVQKLYQEEWSKVEADINLLESESNSTQQERLEILKTLPVPLVKRYEQIASKRAGTGIAMLIKETCQACKRTVPPELFNRVAKGEVLESCPFCHRLLVV